jgi:hypothetical protein
LGRDWWFHTHVLLSEIFDHVNFLSRWCNDLGRVTISVWEVGIGIDMCAVLLSAPPQTVLIEILRNTLNEVERTTQLPQEGQTVADLRSSLNRAIKELQAAKVVEICGAHGVPPGGIPVKRS